jgi:hypothetical protein
LLRDRERVIDLNAQISDGALDFCVTEQELNGPKVAGAPIDQCRLGPPKGMRAEKLGIVRLQMFLDNVGGVGTEALARLGLEFKRLSSGVAIVAA